MRGEDIIEIGVDEVGRLYVKPSKTSFDYIYRAAMEVNWDKASGRLLAPKPEKWTYGMWFRHIRAAAAEEYGVKLEIVPATIWTNVPHELKAEILSD